MATYSPQPGNYYYSSSLLNYVEKTNDGLSKTIFYSEINTNLSKGDTVYIINGNYDFEVLYGSNYGKGADGYSVLDIDGCKIILDIDYTGVKLYENVTYNNFINVYHVSSQREFDYINGINIGLTSFGVVSKFSGDVIDGVVTLYASNIIYASDAYLESTLPDIYNTGITSSGFFVKSIDDPTLWVNISEYVLNNNFSTINKLFIIGEDIQYGQYLFKQRNIYKYVNGKYVIDVTYKQAYISKLNFRSGNFAGTHNDGVFGTCLKQTYWNNGDWNSGILLNTHWASGTVGSKSSTSDKTIYAKLLNSNNGASSVLQSIDYSNNRGFGYNYIIDSVISKGTIINGNFINCNINGASSSSNAVGIFYGSTYSGGISAKNGIFSLCDIKNSDIKNSRIVYSEVINSNLLNSILINSQIIDSSADKCDYNAANGIKILAADLWAYDKSPGSIASPTSTTIKGIVKLFISDEDAIKINNEDTFFISKINKDYILSSLTNDTKIILPIQSKFIFDFYTEYELNNGNKIIVSVKSKNDNTWATNVNTFISSEPPHNRITSNILIPNKFSGYASIDIEANVFGWYYNISNTLSVSNSYTYLNSYILNPITIDNINDVFTNTFIDYGDFKSGIFNNSNWLSGNNTNNYENIIKKNVSNIGNLDITLATPYIKVNLSLNDMGVYGNVLGEDLFINDIIWLNSIDYINGTSSTSISDTYSVHSITYYSNYKQIYLTPVNFDLTQLIPGGFFSITNASKANYGSLNKFIISNSVINNGIFKRTGIVTTKIINNSFDNYDRNIISSNVNQLTLINIIFKDTNNSINSGLIYKSHFINNNWNNGILFNSIWNSGTFNDGVVKNSVWVNGTFNKGLFLDSKGTLPSVLDYDSGNIANSDPRYYNWLNGVFNAGEFYNSVWLNGIFNNGRFYNSDWYGGLWLNGILGSINYSLTNTTMGAYAPIGSIGSASTIWKDGVVENAQMGGYGVVHWYGGKFNNGDFTSYGSNNTNETIWYGGDFNGGKFSNLARWKTGTFNNGKFLSYYGWDKISPTNSSTYSTDYGWESGTFNNGEFGNGTYVTNSVWFFGEFNNGNFKGRFWNDGIFYKGNFFGSGILPGITPSSVSNIEEFNFVNSFTHSFYGLWNNGWVIDTKYTAKTDTIVYTDLVRKKEQITQNNLYVNFNNVLWINGTFSHANANLINSIWLGGNFNSGNFNGGVFNPYVDRTFIGTQSNASFNTVSSVWNDGNFITGSFYISEWLKGTFNAGYMSGAIWYTGTWNYGYADNILWLNGRWRNGNWNGTPFNNLSIFTASSPYTIKAGRENDIVNNISNYTGNSKIHLINAFSSSVLIPHILSDYNIIVPITNASSNWKYTTEYRTGIIGWNTPSDSTLVYFGTYTPPANYRPVYGSLTASGWGSTISYVTTRTLPHISPSNTILMNDNNNYSNSGVIDDGILNKQPYLGYNNYSKPDVPPSSKLYACSATGSINIFATESNITYTIELKVAVELADTVTVECGIGGLSASTFVLNSSSYGYTYSGAYYVDNLANVYDITLNYTITDDLAVLENARQFYIKKTSNGILRLLRADIKKIKSEYHPIYNNTLTESISDGTIYIPSGVSVTSIADDGNVVSLNYGNGAFKSGIWENGIWNNGYRSSSWFNDTDDIYKLSNISNGSVYQTDTNTWFVTLKSIDFLTGISVGDKVGIGNIIAIDINETRKIIKDYFTVVGLSKDNKTITVKYLTNFPIRRLEKDSDKHLMYLTKNIWQSGAFLNGYFRGVWNNGLFKGYPKITEMYDSHWVDGTFDGGHFVSIKYLSNPGLGIPEYNTGLIQNFNFYDNNKLKPLAESFLSWIDVTYYNGTLTELYTNSKNYLESSDYLINGYIYNNRNLIGYPTYDVLSSVSSFKDYLSTTLNTYNLGIKYTKYDQLNRGNVFVEPFSNTIQKLGLDNLTLNGWNIDYLYYSDVPYYSLSGNTNQYNSQQMMISNVGGTYSYTDQVNKLGTFDITVDNNDYSNISNNRYSVVEISLDKHVVNNPTGSQPDNSYVDYRQYDSIAYLNSYLFNNDLAPRISDINNDRSYDTNVIKSRYYYNKNYLGIVLNYANGYDNDLSIGLTAGFTVSFNSITIYEVDMIPFFIYATASQIDVNIKTPLVGIAPYIDYSNSTFDYIGNVNLTFNSQGINNQNITINNQPNITNTGGVVTQITTQ